MKFDNRYEIIGDFDFFVRLSLIRNINVIQDSLAYYRIHDQNLSKKRIDLNIKELESWLIEKEKIKNFNHIGFSKVYKLIEILKIKKNIIEGKKLKALFGIVKRTFEILKLKFFS